MNLKCKCNMFCILCMFGILNGWIGFYSCFGVDLCYIIIIFFKDEIILLLVDRLYL